MLIIVLVNALEQMSLELRLERFQQLIVPDLWWQPVPCQWCRHCKTTSSKIVAVETTTRSPRVDDHSLLLALTDDTGWQKSAGYCGAKPRKAL